MKKLFYFFLAISLFHQFAGTQWLQQNSGVSNALYNIQFVNRFTGWATGSNSTILKTTNGGLIWFNQSINLQYPKNLWGINMLNANTGYITGWFETILKTTNGGSNWQIISNIPSNNGNSNNSCYFIDSQTGWISSFLGRVLKTTNGGINWDTSSVGNDGPLLDIQFLNSLTGFVCGDGGNLRKSTDGGVNWFGFPLLTTANLPSLHFLNKDTGWVVSEQDNFIFRTTNSGVKWDTIAQLPGGNLQYSYSIYFTGPLTGYIGGTYTRLFKTVNGGFNWYRDSISNLGFINNFSFYNDTVGWAVGGGGLIINTTNGGLLSSVNSCNEILPNDYILLQNFPNPFNPITKIKYQIANKKYVSIVISDMIGREISILVKQNQSAGIYETEWDASKYPSGIYFYSLAADGIVMDTKKMVLIK